MLAPVELEGSDAEIFCGGINLEEHKALIKAANVEPSAVTPNAKVERLGKLQCACL